MVGESEAFKAMLNKINRAANSDISVLLFGETGTGKAGVPSTSLE